MQGIYRTRLTAMLAAAFGMALTSFIGALAAHSTPGVVAAAAVTGYIFSAIGQIGPAAATVSLNSFVAFVLFSSQPLAAPVAAQESALVLAGGLIQAALLLAAWPAARGTAERAALADVYRNLADYAAQIAAGSPAIPPITPLATARQVLADPQPFARAAELARFNRLLEDSEVIRRRLGALAALDAEHRHSTVAELANAIADRLSATADVLTGVADEVAPLELSAFDDALRFAGAEDLAAHAHDAAEAAMMLAIGRLPRFALLSKARPGPYVHNRIDWLNRDCLRFALVVGVAMVLGRHFAAERGYWIPMTAALVLKPDLQTTFVRGGARIAGTLAGAVVASFALALVRGHPALELAGLLTATAAAYLAFNPNYALFTVAITSFVVMILSMRGLPGTTTVDARLLDTLAGGALAMIGYLIFPTWEHRRTRALLADLLNAQRALVGSILHEYADPSAEARKAIEARRNDIWRVRTSVETSIDRTRHEPHRHHSIGAGRALRILAATQRLGLACLALETVLETQHPIPPAGLRGFAAALDSEMAELSQALRESRRARHDDGVSAAASQIQTHLAATDREHDFITGLLRDFVEATGRIARLVGVTRGYA
ncbi:MAG TPA: FUSC family protein [Candidatus Cybelea sp.]|nr:FUSC family protein [Candidatus Cybelea sp.]